MGEAIKVKDTLSGNIVSWVVSSDYPDPQVLFKKDYDFSKDSPRYELINLIEEDKGKPIDILDIGCATGNTLKALKAQRPWANLYGVEMDKGIAKEAAKYADVYVGSIEDFISSSKRKYDYVIMGDVLEHLLDPWVTLRDIKKNLIKPDGCLLASIPNVQNIMVVLNLLRGRFPYPSNDIINKWHLRFFTLYEIEEMLRITGFKEYSFGANLMDFNDGVKELIKKIKEVVNLPGYQHFEAYQFIIKAR